MSAPSLSILPGSLFLIEDVFYAAANERKRVFQNRNFVVSGHVLAGQLELFELLLDRPQFLFRRGFVHGGTFV